MTIKRSELHDRIAQAIGQRALQRVKGFIESRTLRAALRLQKRDGRWWLGVPHYWAVYYHDGRGPSLARPNLFLIWYWDPRDDPRHHGNYPVRAVQIRRLNIPWEQLLQDVEDGKAVIARMSPRSGGSVRGKHFFDRGLHGFFRRSTPEAQKTFRRVVRQEVPEAFERRTVRGGFFV